MNRRQNAEGSKQQGKILGRRKIMKKISFIIFLLMAVYSPRFLHNLCTEGGEGRDTYLGQGRGFRDT